MLPAIDIFFLIFLSGFIFYGLFFGLIKSAGNIIGIAAGAWVASRTYLIFFSYVSHLALDYQNLGKVLSFIICFVIVNRLVGLLFALLDRTYSLLTIVPFLKTINRLSGAVLGFVQGGLILGLMLFVTVRYTPVDSTLAKILAESKFAPHLLDFGNFITPLLPDIIKKLNGII